MIKSFKKTGYPIVLLASVPLLMLGGCASTNSNKPAETAMTEVTEMAHPMAETQADNGTVEIAVLEADAESNVASMKSDVQPAASDDELFPTTAIVEKPEERIIGFGFDKADVESSYHELLKQHAQYLIENPDMTLQLNGHTDSSGDKTYNQFLSKKRADEVARLLVEYGAPQDRIKVLGNADDEPLISAIHHREHRRVELNYQDQRLVSK